MVNNKTVAFVVAIGFIFLNLSGHCYGALQFGFYNGKCRGSDVEDIVRKTVLSKFLVDRTITPALLRMQFHDCFVNGCDASILLDGTNSEKTAPPNLSVRGYDVIDAVKTAVERVCPDVVSCADIIVMATRDAVSLSGGGRYNVQTGRRDGRVSLAKDAQILPSPSSSVSSAIQAFATKGLTATDMIYLLGGHTIGIAHCSFFQDRLYNFENSGKPDPTMDLALLTSLRRTCPRNATVDGKAHNRRINELKGAVSNHAGDGELRIIVDGVVGHYEDIFRIKGDAAKADVFHVLSGMWKTPAERCFLWLGGFRSSELLKLLITQLEPLTEQQLLAIGNLQQSSQQAEDALSQGMEALQQSLAETIAGSLATSNPSSGANVANYMGQMAMAMGKLGTLEGFIRQADNLRQQTLQQMHRILTTRQSARALIAINDYSSRLRALSSLWLARPRE